MDYRSELARERADLARADSDLREGGERVAAQASLVAGLRASGHDLREAERLLRLLGETLVQWGQHRVLILERIAHLEAKLSAAGPAGGGAGAASAPAPPHLR